MENVMNSSASPFSHPGLQCDRAPIGVVGRNKETSMTAQRTGWCSVHPQVVNRRTLLRYVAAVGLAAPALAALLSSSTRVARAGDPVSGLLDAALAAAVEQGLPGVTLLVERDGEPVYAGAAGVASIEREAPLKPTDRHRIYSIAKAFTATVVLQLVDEGVLQLDDTVARWLDDPAVGRIPHVDRITLRQLLNHTSGIYDYGDEADSPFFADAFLGEGADWATVWTPQELLTYADGAWLAPSA
jgi:D-alanyl-D-alanine carboxypeptidase